MKTFKITNITNFAAKRDSKFNMAIDIEYIDNRTKKVINLKAGDNVFLTVDSLPLSVHRLRIKNLITIEEVNLAALTKPADNPKRVKRPKPIKKVIVEKKKEPEIEKKSSTKKKTVTE